MTFEDYKNMVNNVDEWYNKIPINDLLFIMNLSIKEQMIIIKALMIITRELANAKTDIENES